MKIKIALCTDSGKELFTLDYKVLKEMLVSRLGSQGGVVLDEILNYLKGKSNVF